MRRTVRPFIKEFKTRSAKSSATHPRPLGDTDNDGSKLSFLDLNVFTTRQNKFEAEHKEALTAADAVFGEGSPVAPLPKASPLSNAPVGRVLPSHIGEDDLLTVRLTEGDGKSRSGRRVGKVKSSSPIRLKKPTRQLESEVARVFLERPATSVGFSGPSSKPERNGSGACARLHAGPREIHSVKQQVPELDLIKR